MKSDTGVTRDTAAELYKDIKSEQVMESVVSKRSFSTALKLNRYSQLFGYRQGGRMD